MVVVEGPVVGDPDRGPGVDGVEILDRDGLQREEQVGRVQAQQFHELGFGGIPAEPLVIDEGAAVIHLRKSGGQLTGIDGVVDDPGLQKDVRVFVGRDAAPPTEEVRFRGRGRAASGAAPRSPSATPAATPPTSAPSTGELGT